MWLRKAPFAPAVSARRNGRCEANRPLAPCVTSRPKLFARMTAASLARSSTRKCAGVYMPGAGWSARRVRRLHEVDERLGFERRAADQAAVNVLFGEQLGRVRRLH